MATRRIDETQQLKRTLHNNRLIKIYIGKQDENSPYLVQEATIMSASDFFVAALKYEGSFGTGESGTLRFPEDNEIAWEILLYWMFNGHISNDLLDDIDLHDLVRCWGMAEKYLMTRFQDEIMCNILDTINVSCVELEVVKLAFEITPPWCALRELMAEELVETLRHWHFEDEDKALQIFDDIGNFEEEFKEARDRRAGGHGMGAVGAHYNGNWARFMVGEGPEQYWFMKSDRNWVA